MSWLGGLSDFGPAPLAVEVYWESYPGKKAHIWRLWQQTGWMQVVRVSLKTPISSHEETISLFCNDMGQPMPAWLGNRLFDMRCSLPTYMHHEPPEALEDHADALYWDFLGRCDIKNLADLDAAADSLSDDILAVEAKALLGVTQIDDFIGTLRREKRHPDCRPDRKPEIDARIAELQPFKPKLLATIPGAIKALRDDYQRYENDVFESVTCHGHIEVLYTVRWTMQSRHMPPPINVSPWTEERFLGNLNVGTRWKENYRAGHRIDVGLDKPHQIRTKRDVKRALKNQEAPPAETRKRGRPPGAKNKVKPPSTTPVTVKSVGVNEALTKSNQRRLKRAARTEIAAILQNYGTISELKYVRAFLRAKTGADLKSALIHLAKHGFMSTNDAVYLFKVLSALRTQTSSKNND